jgi:hypothetical protein
LGIKAKNGQKFAATISCRARKSPVSGAFSSGGGI